MMMIGGRALAGRMSGFKGEVVRPSMPAVLVVVKITAGNWVVRERIIP